MRNLSQNPHAVYMRAYNLRPGPRAKKVARDRAYREANLERCKARGREYARTHQAEARGRFRRWYALNREQYIQQVLA